MSLTTKKCDFEAHFEKNLRPMKKWGKIIWLYLNITKGRFARVLKDVEVDNGDSFEFNQNKSDKGIAIIQKQALRKLNV